MRSELEYNLKNFLTWKKGSYSALFLFWLTLKLNVRHYRPLRKKHVFRS